jgi:hypothetical protein
MYYLVEYHPCEARNPFAAVLEHVNTAFPLAHFSIHPTIWARLVFFNVGCRAPSRADQKAGCFYKKHDEVRPKTQ